MKHRKTAFCILLLYLFIAVASSNASLNHTSKAKNLFIIVMNGVRYDDTFGDKNHLYIEHIWSKLRPLGTFCSKFDNSELTYPIPSQMSLLT
jgi:hypothetical protein